MANLAGDVSAPGPREIAKLLAPFPGRASFVTRIALMCALTTLIASAYGTPDAALSTYLVFFFNKPDRVTSIVTSVVLFLLVTTIIGIVMAFAIFCIDVPALRVACMAVLSFGLLFVTSASKLRPVGATVAMIVGYGLDELGQAPIGEAATRGLLYAWLFVSIPIGVSIIVNLLLAPSPRKLLCARLAKRLRLAAGRLTGTVTEAGRAEFDACLREGNHEILAWLKFSKLEGTSTDADCAALREAASATIAILLAADLAASEPGARLPAKCAERLGQTMEQMAAMLEAGGYPVEVTVDLRDLPEAAALPPLAALVLADLRAALEGFAVPPAVEVAPSAPAAPADHASERGGFFNADAFTNPEHVRYALKTTVAAMFCYLLYQQLDWQGIHTCFLTCYIVSLGTTAESVEKLTLRIAGCLIGALAGTAAIVFVTPALTTIGELMALVFVGAWLAAWVAVGSPRISYVGFQISFAFFLCVIQGAAPAFDLTIARDRAIGILIGNVVVYLVLTRVWPVSIAKRIDTALTALVGQWVRVGRSGDALARRTLAAGAVAQYGALYGDLGLIHYEPSWVRPEPEWIASRRRALAELGALEGPLFFAAGRAATEADARLNEVAGRITAGSVVDRQTSPPAGGAEPGTVARHSDGETSANPTVGRAAAPDVDALLNVIDTRFGEIAGAACSPTEGDDDRCAPLNRRPG
jgi:multidrug resistance protein MdtO